MPSDRRIRKFVRQWRRRYPHPVEWVDDRANKQHRRSEADWFAQFEGASSLKRREVKVLVDWRFAGRADLREEAFAGIDSPAAWGRAQRCIRKALKEESPAKALEHLLGETGGIPGWGPAMASVVLAAARPDLYAVADEQALGALEALGLIVPRRRDRFDRSDWWPYLRICRNLASECGTSLRGVHQALWAAGNAAPSLPGKPKKRQSRRAEKGSTTGRL